MGERTSLRYLLSLGFSVVFLLLPGEVLLLGRELPEPYTGVRPAGMGNAFTGLANDHNAIWTNPAGISRIRKVRSRRMLNMTHFPNLLGGTNAKGFRFYQKLQASGGSKRDAELIGNILSDLDELSDASVWARASSSLLGFFDLPGARSWASGLVTNSILSVTRDKDDRAVAIVDSVADLGGVVAFGLTNRTNRLNIAVQMRPTFRFNYYNRIPVQSLMEFSSGVKGRIKEDSNNGLGIGLDAGLMWTFADHWFPTVGIAVRNLPTGCINGYLNAFEQERQRVCGTKYRGAINNPDSPGLMDPMDGRIGISITPRITNKLALRFTADYHHIYLRPDNKTYYGLSGIEPMKQAHAGVELFIGNPLLLSPLSLRIGFNQGFITYGASVRTGFFLIEGAVYGRDTAPGPAGREDRRIIASIAAEFR